MKNKKLLLIALLSVFVFSGAFAQFSYTTNTNIGQVLKNSVYLDTDTLAINFNTAIVPSFWSFPVATPTTPTVSWKNCQTQKGLQALGYINATTTSAFGFGSYDCRDYGAQRNPIHVTSIDSLQKLMIKSVYVSTKIAPPATPTYGVGGNQNDSVYKSAACLFDRTSGGQAFGMYPGRCKRIEYGFQFDFTGKQVENINFDVLTYSPGNTNKTATYSITVATGSVSSVVYTNSNFYTTGSSNESNLKSVNLVTETGLTAGTFSNKKVYILIKTLGTSNSSNIVDGMANDTIAGTGKREPAALDPTIVFDDILATYQIATWKAPLAALDASKTNTYVDHNNGSPAILGGATANTDFNAGTPVTVPAATNTSIKFYITSVGRVQNLNIKEANSGSATVPNFSITAIKAKDSSGNFTTDVTFTPSKSGVINVYDIAAPSLGTVANDTLEITVTANVPDATTKTIRYEITNGTRFWYDIAATGSSTVAIKPIDASATSIYSNNAKVFVTNATENVTITNVAGQRVKTVSAADASGGIQVPSGIYLVKTGSTVQKVVVK